MQSPNPYQPSPSIGSRGKHASWLKLVLVCSWMVLAFQCLAIGLYLARYPETARLAPLAYSGFVASVSLAGMLFFGVRKPND